MRATVAENDRGAQPAQARRQEARRRGERARRQVLEESLSAALLAARAHRAASRLADLLAIVAAAVLLAGALVVTYSVLLRVVASGQVRGDFELMAVSSGIAIFLFLPYCQARRGHVLIEVFTAWLPPRAQSAMDRLWSLALGVGAGLLTARLAVGLEEAWTREHVTMMLQLPLSAVFAAAIVGVAGTAILALLDFIIAVERAPEKGRS